MTLFVGVLAKLSPSYLVDGGLCTPGAFLISKHVFYVLNVTDTAFGPDDLLKAEGLDKRLID